MSVHNTLCKGVLPFAVAFSLSSSLMAATDGEPARLSDGGSVGTSDMTMTVPKLVRITGLTDIAITEQEVFDAIDQATPHQELVDACVGGNGTFTYGVTIAGTNGYQLDPQTGSATNPVAFSVAWKTAPATDSTPLVNQTLDQENLGGAACNNNNLAVTVLDTDLYSAREGTYASTLTLTVVPE